MFYFLDKTNDQLTGGGRSVLNLLRGVRKFGVEPVLVAQCKGVLAKTVEEEDVIVRIIPLPEQIDVYEKKILNFSVLRKAGAAYALLQYNQRIRTIAREHQVNGIWARGLRSVLQVGLAARMSCIPLVWDIGVELRSKGLVRFLRGTGLFLSDRVVTQATAQQERIFGQALASWYSESFRTVYPGIASARIVRLREGSTMSEKQPPEILSVGSIHPRKNQRLSLRAFRHVHERYPEAALTFAGPVKDEEYANSLRAYVRDHDLDGSVQFLGWRDDVPELLGRSSLLVLSSHREGVPHVIREAMFAEVPVVATAVGGVPEAVENGHTGFLVPEDAAKKMAERIGYLLSNPEERRTMGKKGLHLAQRRFSREGWLTEYADLLNKLG